MAGDPPSGRILLKLSGELLAGGLGSGLDPQALAAYAGELVKVSREGWRLGVVIGGGNVIRGVAAAFISRNRADSMGMLATVINAIALQDAVERAGGRASVLTAFTVQGLTAYSHDEASRVLDSGAIAIYAGGTGNPFLSTDTAAALRAVQTGCSLLLKGTKVDGVYDMDPKLHPEARRFARLSWDEVLARGLGVMDAAAVAVCRDNSLPFLVFDSTDPAGVSRALRDGSTGTLVGEGSLECQD